MVVFDRSACFFKQISQRRIVAIVHCSDDKPTIVGIEMR